MNSGNKILLLLPTRSRPENVERFYKFWKENSSGLNDVVVLVDRDDERIEEYYKFDQKKFIIVANDRMNLVQKLNFGWKLNNNLSDIIGFVGDDTIIETKDWDQKVVEKFKELGKYGMLYPNDGYNKHNVPNHIFVTRQWCETLGWFAYPGLNHLFIDKVWQMIGIEMNKSKVDGKYFHAMDIVIRHLHFAFDEKIEKDNLYKDIYLNYGQMDTIIYNKYVTGRGFLKDLNKMI